MKPIAPEIDPKTITGGSLQPTEDGGLRYFLHTKDGPVEVPLEVYEAHLCEAHERSNYKPRKSGGRELTKLERILKQKK